MRLSHPEWLKVKAPFGRSYVFVRQVLRNNNLNTVCDSASCPNIAECWGRKTATFMILGKTCTRDCRYCGVRSGEPEEVDEGEPERIAKAAAELKLSYVVVTSVTRDDLKDGGSRQFARTIRGLKNKANAKVEVLIPDFKGSMDALDIVLDEKPDVCGHNIEVARSVFGLVRPGADYDVSMGVLNRISKRMGHAKSGLMIGIGERREDIIDTMKALRKNGCTMLTIGQYLSPSRNHAPIKKYYTPEEFFELESTARSLGFLHVMSGPLVRSSYHAHEAIEAISADGDSTCF